MDSIGIQGTSMNISSFHRSTPVLVWYTGECMVSVINSNEGIKEPTHGYEDCNTTHNSGIWCVCSENLCMPKLLFGSIQF